MESKRSIKIFVTGGHFTPAKAVTEELLKKGYQVFYVGRRFSLEGDSAESLEFKEFSPRRDLTFLEITAGRMPRRFTSKSFSSLLKIPYGFFQSISWFIKFRPDAVMSFGGYVAIPIATIAFLFGVPVVNHEQIPAFDYPSKYLNTISKKVLVSFPHLVKTKEIYTGNPVREDIFKASRKLTLPKSKTIYITGGNQGSHTINSVILSLLPDLLKKYNIIWQTGDSQEYKDFDKVKDLTDKNLLVKKFISSDEIGSVFAASDLVIGRSGANTVTELAALGKPSILIPIPWVHDAEQQKNAESLANFGGSIIIPQKDLSPDSLNSAISAIMPNLENYKKRSTEAKKLYIASAKDHIVKELEAVINAQKN